MSLVGFKARNHPQQAAVDSVDDRGTRREFFDPLHAEYCFTVDVAASAENALLPRYFTRETDGLSQSWSGERVWCNPPYSNIEAWLVKAWQEMEANACGSVTMLLPANRCEQGWWQRHIEPRRDIVVIGGGGTARDAVSSRSYALRLARWPRRSAKGRSPAVRVRVAHVDAGLAA